MSQIFSTVAARRHVLSDSKDNLEEVRILSALGPVLGTWSTCGFALLLQGAMFAAFREYVDTQVRIRPRFFGR